ncbi:LuxR C-terminal-related transcriptional regulator [Nonomuraea solani]|uniref:LuxR C-terminal-related transcriptional regulator n=1 Tax=Nonomuraea solani TaxID=1144553 RepID=UPI0011B0A289|nr:response regulator transcription factor [Nonomuraea solani]
MPSPGPPHPAAARVDVLVIEADPLARGVIKDSLRREPCLNLLAEADGRDGARKLMRSCPHCVVVIDPYQPKMGSSVLHEIAETCQWQVLVFTATRSRSYVSQAVAAGAMGYLLKENGACALSAAVVSVASGNVVLADSAARALLPMPAGGSTRGRLLRNLTEQELRILRFLSLGASTSEIAAVLRISDSTVKSHVSHMLSKLEVRDRTQAVVFAYQSGLISVADFDWTPAAHRD